MEVTIPFKGTLFLGALLDGAIMGYLVNRKIRDITPYLVSIIPLAWLAYGSEALQPPILKFGRTNPSLHSFRYFSRRLSNIFVEILQILAHGHHELVGVSAIDDAMIIAHGEADNVPHGN